MMNFEKIFRSCKVKSTTGRYVTIATVYPFLEGTIFSDKLKTIGSSVLGAPIKMLTLGQGKTKILMWSQMHGNESTTTKAVLDFINFLSQPGTESKLILEHCTICILPILNPDGAEAYTRVNANTVDLNRDAQDRSQPESKVLRQVYDAFAPDYCFNLHDQRTIFNVGTTNKPATVSFLAPAFNKERTVSLTRAKSMQLIVAMNTVLQQFIPGQVGRYDDGFNSNCVGDAFQMLDTPTVLFESGHYPEDYDREKTREYIFYALLTAVTTIAENLIENFKVSAYLGIPENGKQFLDIIITNAHLVHSKYKEGESLGILYKEVLRGDTLNFVPDITEKGNLDHFFAHKEYNCLIDSDLIELKNNSELYIYLF
ncbi:M14 family metallopeptidase [Cellulophaga sp. F20128]|uniref:M14 family metallopeptidase n=1 Tax=Cellulophaga sp. F20128 TaxID=2926413 RepID=UPI001FF2FAB7|nr:M14 metallopeptidase family protein [Cellulophaga sp. F20128]MCK0157853.1 M14 family metallopeptidase [Cellulophaga sp. F20128]